MRGEQTDFFKGLSLRSSSQTWVEYRFVTDWQMGRFDLTLRGSIMGTVCSTQRSKADDGKANRQRHGLTQGGQKCWWKSPTNDQAEKPQVLKEESWSLCSLWLISFLCVRNAFFGFPLCILLVYWPFQPFSFPLYFQLLEEFGLEVDQSNPVLLWSLGSYSYKQVMS